MIRNFDRVRSEVQRAVKRAKSTGERQRVFVNSMSDFFEDRRDLDEARLEALDMMRCSPECDFLLLTKRPEKIMEILVRALDDEMEKSCPISGFGEWLGNWIFAKGQAPRNIWLGPTVESQKYADERMQKLMEVPARVRFLSVEPQLGHVDLFSAYTFWKPLISPGEVGQKIHWVIVGGESGKHIRKVDLSWFISLRRQCQAAKIAFFVKQLDGTIPGFQDFETFPPELQVRQFPQVG
jgi:protein gp37